jgi:hypothetical protein
MEITDEFLDEWAVINHRVVAAFISYGTDTDAYRQDCVRNGEILRAVYDALPYEEGSLRLDEAQERMCSKEIRIPMQFPLPNRTAPRPLPHQTSTEPSFSKRLSVRADLRWGLFGRSSMTHL